MKSTENLLEEMIENQDLLSEAIRELEIELEKEILNKEKQKR